MLAIITKIVKSPLAPSIILVAFKVEIIHIIVKMRANVSSLIRLSTKSILVFCIVNPWSTARGHALPGHGDGPREDRQPRLLHLDDDRGLFSDGLERGLRSHCVPRRACRRQRRQAEPPGRPRSARRERVPRAAVLRSSHSAGAG